MNILHDTVLHNNNNNHTVYLIKKTFQFVVLTLLATILEHSCSYATRIENDGMGSMLGSGDLTKPGPA
jgi:hypothetical protein